MFTKNTDCLFDSAEAKEMECYLLPCRGQYCEPHYADHYRSAYDLWKTQMGHALKYESKLVEPELRSDDFFRQKELIAIFLKEEAIGLMVLDWLDLSFASTLECSYIQGYPTSVIHRLIETGYQKLMTMGNLCVHPQWRRSVAGSGLSEAVIGLSVKRFLSSKAQGLLTYTRNERGIHRLVYSFGGIPLMRDHLSHGMASDIILTQRDHVIPCTIPGIQSAVDRLYAQCIDTQVDNAYFHWEPALALDEL